MADKILHAVYDDDDKLMLSKVRLQISQLMKSTLHSLFMDWTKL